MIPSRSTSSTAAIFALCLASAAHSAEPLNMAVLTPYGDELTRSTAQAVTGRMRTVVAAEGMGIQENARLADPAPPEIVRFARSVLAGGDFDVLFVSCANFRALEAKPLLEAAFDVPVVTSNGAAIEAAILHLGLDSGRETRSAAI